MYIHICIYRCMRATSHTLCTVCHIHIYICNQVSVYASSQIHIHVSRQIYANVSRQLRIHVSSQVPVHALVPMCPLNAPNIRTCL